MENDNLLNEIKHWDSFISQLNTMGQTNNRIYEIAFFKIFVVFERFLSDLFLQYSSGKASSKLFTPERRLCFDSEEHVISILRNTKTSFIDYIEKIEKISEHIFVQGKNPFNIILTSPYRDYYIQSRYLRNYIAHESAESRDKLKGSITFFTTKTEIDIGDFLSTLNRKTSQTNYSLYTQKLWEISTYLVEPKQLF